jgi:hypothetical protein
LNLRFFGRRIESTKQITGIRPVSIPIKKDQIVIDASNLHPCFQNFDRFLIQWQGVLPFVLLFQDGKGFSEKVDIRPP